MNAIDIGCLTVLGDRPQFIKTATVSRAIAAHNARAATEIQRGQYAARPWTDWNLFTVGGDSL